MRKLERLRVGIIGTGWGARVQVPAFREAGIEVVAISGRDRDKTARTAQTLSIDRVAGDWRAMIAATDIDLISVVTPPSLHREMAVSALENGKHLLSEKPTALNASEAAGMVEAAERHPEQLALIDHELRLLPAWREARRQVREIGPIRYFEMRYSSPGRGDRSKPWTWWSDADHGGGILGAVGSHLIDAIRYLIGEIEEVSADLQTIIEERSDENGRRAVTSDDLASLRFRLRGGSSGTTTLSVVAAVDEPTTITIHGERGGLRLAGEELLAKDSNVAWKRIAGSDLSDRVGNSAGGAFGSGTLLLAQALRSALVDGRSEELSDAATFADGLAQQRVLDAARSSSTSEGAWTKV